MSLTAAAIRLLAAAGLSVELIADVAEANEAPPPVPVETKEERRRRMERDRKRAKRATDRDEVSAERAQNVRTPPDRERAQNATLFAEMGANCADNEDGPHARVRDKPLRLVTTEGKEVRDRTEGISLDARDDVRKAFDLYNLFAKRVCCHPAAVLNETRRSKLAKRLKEVGGLIGWTQAMKRASESPFLMGEVQGHESFKLSLDFLLQASSFLKLIEGFYDARRPNSPPPGSPEAKHLARQENLQRSFRGAQLSPRPKY